MTRQLYIFIILMFSYTGVYAQKKQMDQVRSIIKSGKNLDKAEKTMSELMKNSANKDNKKMYMLWYQTVQAQYDAANEKLYLNQKQDTAQFFNMTLRMFNILEALDSVDMKPDKKGRVAPEYRRKNAEILDTYRRNLLSAGIFFVRHADYNNAMTYLNAYIDCTRQPIFTGYDYLMNDGNLPQAAYWYGYSAIELKQWEKVLEYKDLAFKDTATTRFTQKYVAEAYSALNDEENYLATLLDGFRMFPDDSYFFTRIIDLYVTRQKPQLALEIADEALKTNGDNTLFLYAKSNQLLMLGRYDEAVEVCRKIIAIDENMAEAYYNEGTAYLNKILELDKQPSTRKLRKQMAEIYRMALPVMEKYRQLKPQESRKWAPALYRIYLNLNMGKQFEEIDRILKK